MSARDDEEEALEMLIAEGLNYQRQIVELKKKLAPVAKRALALAKDQRNSNEKCIKLTALSGNVARVTFSGETGVDSIRAKKLSQQLPEDVFGTIFSVTERFGLASGYKAFMDGDSSSALKKAVGASIFYRDRKPSVKFVPIGGGDVEDDDSDDA